MMRTHTPESRAYGKRVLIALISFFIVFASVDAFFVYKALNTFTGESTEQPYEKGLAFNENLESVRQQEAMGITASVRFENGRLIMRLKDKHGGAIKNAEIKARLVRVVQEGYDFDTTLSHKGEGVYEVSPKFPLQGLWRADLDAQWQEPQQIRHYRTTLTFSTR